jgi:CHAD domain-containing protein
MGYRLIQDETLPRGLKRIARDEIAAAIAQLGEKDASKRDFSIHEARKSIKKLRGLMRMLAPVPGTAAQEDIAALGALGRSLSGLRDAAALVEAVDLLGRHAREARVHEQLADLRRALQKRSRETIERSDIQVILEAAIIGLRQVKRHLPAWRMENSFDAIAPGLRNSYRRGKKALRLVRAEGTAENFHGLRKRVKDRWYQVRILEGVWPHPGRSREKDLRELQEDLGDDHNLDVLRAFIPADSCALLELLEATQRHLREKSVAVADDLYDCDADSYVQDLRSLWEGWQPAPRMTSRSQPATRRARSAA